MVATRLLVNKIFKIFLNSSSIFLNLDCSLGNAPRLNMGSKYTHFLWIKLRFVNHSSKFENFCSYWFIWSSNLLKYSLVLTLTSKACLSLISLINSFHSFIKGVFLLFVWFIFSVKWNSAVSNQAVNSLIAFLIKISPWALWNNSFILFWFSINSSVFSMKFPNFKFSFVILLSKPNILNKDFQWSLSKLSPIKYL